MDIYSKLHVLETKPYFKRHIAGHESPVSKVVASVLGTPDPIASDYVAAEPATERLKDAFADYFQRYDASLCLGWGLTGCPDGLPNPPFCTSLRCLNPSAMCGTFTRLANVGC